MTAPGPSSCSNKSSPGCVTNTVPRAKPPFTNELKSFLMMGKSEIPHARVAAELKLTEGAVRVAVHRLRRRYRELLREEITQTLANPAQADEEMQALFQALAGN